MDENRVGEGTPGLPLAARRSINMLPRPGTREPPCGKLICHLPRNSAAPFYRGPSVPRVFVHGIATEKIKSVDPPPDTAAHTLPTTFATVFSPLRGGISFSGKSSESLTILADNDSFLLVSRSREEMFIPQPLDHVFTYAREIYQFIALSFRIFPFGFVDSFELTEEYYFRIVRIRDFSII